MSKITSKQIGLIVVIILLGISSVIFYTYKNTKETSLEIAAPSDTSTPANNIENRESLLDTIVIQRYAYIDTIEAQDTSYLVSIRELDFIGSPDCTNDPEKVTDEIPECNPNGYLIQNIQPGKTYVVKNPESVYYSAPIANDDGFTEEKALIPFDEFYRNFINQEDTITSKRIFYRGSDAIYQIRIQNDEITDIVGFYTP